MPRSTADTDITTKTARERLATRHQPYWRGIDAGAALGYRKGTTGGVWLVRLADPSAGGGYRQASLARAAGKLESDGIEVLEYRAAKERARQWIARQNRIAAGEEPEPSAKATTPYTVNDALSDYLADYTARGGKGLPQTRASVDALILPPLGALSVGRLTRERIKTWHRDLATAPARLRGRAGVVRHREPTDDHDAPRRRRSTANRVLTILKAALNHARAEGKVSCPADAWSAVKPFREADLPKVRYLLDAEITRLMNACASDFRLLVTAALLTGARYGELAAMKVGDFDPQSGTVTVARSKSGKTRHVVLTDEGRAFFERAILGKAGSALIFMRDATIRQATKDAPAETRRSAWGKSDQFRLLREACTAARIAPAISFHILRHTYASRLAMKGVPMAVIAAQLGHSDTRMTERHYAHVAPSYVADVVRAAFGPLGVRSETENVVAL